MILRSQEALTLFLIAPRNNCIDGEPEGHFVDDFPGL
jgi:hypothetical protein